MSKPLEFLISFFKYFIWFINFIMGDSPMEFLFWELYEIFRNSCFSDQLQAISSIIIDGV